MSTHTHPPTTTAKNDYYAALQFGANDQSDDKTVVMTNRLGENLKDEESTVETAFSVWGSDNESELDHGVGGLDPARHDDRPLNGPAKARERPALITIKNPNKSINSQGQKLAFARGSGNARGSGDRNYFQSTKFPCKSGGKELESTRSYPTVIPTTLPPSTSLLFRTSTRQQTW